MKAYKLPKKTIPRVPGSHEQNWIDGITGKTFFQFQDAGKPISLGIFSRGKFITAPAQYYPVGDPRFVPNFNAKLEDQRVITRGGSYFYKTDIVYSGINYNEISNIDENEPSYFVDFYLWFRYRPNDQDEEFKPDDFVCPIPAE